MEGIRNLRRFIPAVFLFPLKFSLFTYNFNTKYINNSSVTQGHFSLDKKGALV